MMYDLSVLVPAVDHNRPREGWIDHLDLFEELQHADGGERNSKVGPAGEVELGDEPGSLSSIAGLLHRDTDADRHSLQHLHCKFDICDRSHDIYDNSSCCN